MDRGNAVGFMIRGLSNLLRRKLFEIAPPPHQHGLTDMGGQIMGYLCDHLEEELYQRDVEKTFCIRRSTASQFLKDLENQHMLRREPVPQDARLKKLIPTEKAIQIHREIEEKAQIIEQLLTKGLTQGEIDQFLKIARKIQGNLDVGAAQ